MEAKKTSRSNLESKRFIFREIGFIVALSMVFFAFESKYYQEETSVTVIPIETLVDVKVLPVFVPQQALRPLPKVTSMPLDVTEVVDALADLEEDIDLIDFDNTNTNGSATGTSTDILNNFTGEEEIGEDDVFIVVEDKPLFNGDLNKWLRNNLRYPTRAAEMGIEGKVFIQFIVEKDGSISGVEAIQSANPDLAAEAIRVVKAMPKWIPGKQRNQAVRVKFTMPVVFKLQR